MDGVGPDRGRWVARIALWRRDVSGISGIGAVGLSGAGLALTIAALALSQADILGGQVDPVTSQAIDQSTVDLRVGEIMGQVDRAGPEPVVSQAVVSASVGLGTERFDLRTLTLRLTNGNEPLLLVHEATNGTTQDGVFTVRAVRDMDGSMREHRIGDGDRVDLQIDLAAVGAQMPAGGQVTLYFHTDGGTELRLQVDAPRSLGQNDWVRMEGVVKRGA